MVSSFQVRLSCFLIAFREVEREERAYFPPPLCLLFLLLRPNRRQYFPSNKSPVALASLARSLALFSQFMHAFPTTADRVAPSRSLGVLVAVVAF